MVRSTLADSELPKSFWAEALATAVYLRNQSSTKCVEGKTSYEAIYGEKPKAWTPESLWMHCLLTY